MTKISIAHSHLICIWQFVLLIHLVTNFAITTGSYRMVKLCDLDPAKVVACIRAGVNAYHFNE